MCAPPLVPAALMCWFVRNEALGVEWQGQLRTRAEVDNNPDAAQWNIATVEDFQEWSQAKTKCVPRVQPIGSVSFLDDDGDCESQTLKSHAHRVLEKWWSGEVPRGSVRHEHEWQRMTRCFNPYLDTKLKIRIFTPGMLSGTWEGRMLVSSLLFVHPSFISVSFHLYLFIQLYLLWISSHGRPLTSCGRILQSYNPSEYSRLFNRTSLPPLSEGNVFPKQYLHAFYATLREHHHLPSKKRAQRMPSYRSGRPHLTPGYSRDAAEPVEDIMVEDLDMPAPSGGDGTGMDGDGVCNAWFPSDAEFREKNVRRPCYMRCYAAHGPLSSLY